MAGNRYTGMSDEEFFNLPSSDTGGGGFLSGLFGRGDDQRKAIQLMSSRTNNDSAPEQVVDPSLDVTGILGKERERPRRRHGEADWVDKFNMGGNILGGLGDLASGWAALQNVGIARDSQKFKEDAWRQNMARQKTTVNNPIRTRQALLKSNFYNDPARANALKLVT